MDGLIQNGEDWMEPLADLREYLIETRDNPAKYRQKALRSGVVRDDAWGPYLPKVRAEILRRLLQAQFDIRQEYDDTMTFVTYQELVAIQVTWYRDGIFDQDVARIYNKIFGAKLDLQLDRPSRQAQEEEKLLREVCCDQPDYANLIQQTLKIVKTNSLLQKRRGLHADIENLLDGYLRGKAVA